MPIDSALLPENAVSYLNGIEQSQQAEKVKQDRAAAMRELLEFCNSWFEKAKQWRKQSYESKWLVWQDNSDSKYSTAIRDLKEEWQSKAFVPVTASHRETIQAALYRMIVGARPPLEIEPRSGAAEEQGQNIRDLILREMEKSRFEMGLNSALEESTTFGTSFVRMRFDEKVEDRKKREPVYAEINPMDAAQVQAAINGNRTVIGYRESIQPTTIYRGTRFEHLSIWDVFPDPKALTIEGNSIAFRFWLSYGEIVQGVEAGYYLPEALEALNDLDSEETTPEDKQASQSNRDISDVAAKRTKYQKKFEIKEIWARLPKKWVLVSGEEIDDPEKLIPARIWFHKSTVCMVALNKSYDGEPDILKLDYVPVAGQFYARGIPEMLAAIQEVINQTVNQRIDNVALCLNKMFAVVMKAIIDPTDLTSRPGQAVRLDAKALGPTGDVKNVILPIDFGDVTRSSYSDVLEFERYAQERTSANRVTLGTTGLVKDSNQTLGGQELLKQSAGEKFAWVGMVMEFTFLHRAFRKYWSLIYDNLTPQDVVDALGPERAQTFRLMSPEEVEMGYRYEPQGIFEMENKAVRQVRLQTIRQQFLGAPWMDDMKFFDLIVKAADENPDNLKYSPQEMQQMIVAKGMMQQASGPMHTGKQEVSVGPPKPTIPGNGMPNA